MTGMAGMAGMVVLKCKGMRGDDAFYLYLSFETQPESVLLQLPAHFR